MENYKDELKVINELIDYQARTLVGTLLKRIEVLSEQNVLTPKLYKAIVKELIYEQARNLKKLIEVNLTVGKVKFIDPKKR